MSKVNLPVGWNITELSETGVIVTGKTPSTKNLEYFGGDIPFIKPGDLNHGGYIKKTAETLTPLGINQVPTLPEKSIVVTCIGNLGKVGITASISATNQQINSLIPNEYLNYKFLYHQLCTLKPWLDMEASATTISIINKSKFSKAPILIAPLAEQKIIADKLDNLLSKVETIKARLDRIPQILKQFRQSVLAAAVSGKLTEDWRNNNPNILISKDDYKKILNDSNFKIKAKGISQPENKGSWLYCCLGHIFIVKSGNGLTSNQMNLEGGIPVYGGNGINGYHDQANINSSAVVIGRVGFYCGSVYLTEEKAWITDNALIVDYSDKLIIKKYAYWLLKATNLREESGFIAQPVISGSKIYPIKILLPPLEEQTEIVRRVEQLFAHADKVEKQVQNALLRVNNLTQSILAKAFRGELTEQWRAENHDLISGENSAEALLAKIKIEREKLATKKKK